MKRKRLLLVVGVLAVLGLVAFGVWRLRLIPVADAACNHTGGTPAVWVGDSYAAGFPVGAENGYACLVGADLDWRVTLDAQGSTGFLGDGSSVNFWYEPAPARLAATAEAAPEAETVVVDLGRNDYTFAPAEVEQAAIGYLRDVRGQWPEARLVVILPWLPDGSTPAALGEALERAASTVGAETIAPREEWATVSTVADGVHPDREGYRMLASDLAGELAP